MKYLFCILLLSWAAANAETLIDHVIGVSDGDTVTVQVDRQRTRVRISAIDAPVCAQAMTINDFFRSLKRPGSPNNWLVAPANFVVEADAVSPTFEAPLSVLRQTFKAVVLQSSGTAIVEELADGMHVVATTPLLRFKDDVRLLFLPVAQDKSTIAVYSASRVGYWDLGTNRRRLEGWITQVQSRLAAGRK